MGPEAVKDRPRLIERGFCLKQASLDSVHEKNVRHGHISTLHIWPARRPLAACRAALIATLLPDPGTPAERKRLLERIGGTVITKVERKTVGGRVVEVPREETVGGILHWGRESGPDLEWFRQEILRAFGGRAPRVLDPFAGGGAIPLEAMRLGCEAAAADINPVAWFILKCTLEYPQRLFGRKRPLPPFVLADREFMERFLESRGLRGATLRTMLERLGHGDGGAPSLAGLNLDASLLEADLAWHVRAWGSWVLERARADLARYYPTVEGKPTVAYLWARTVPCKNCRASIPLLKTRWLCKKENKRVLLTMKPKTDGSGVDFGVQGSVPAARGNAAEKREHDRRIGQGTMSRSGAWCPCCGQPGTVAMEIEDIRQEGLAGRLGAVMTAVVVDGRKGKEYRPPTGEEIRLAEEAAGDVDQVFAEIPFGIPDEPLPNKEALGFRVPLYGFDRWSKLFTPRQLLALGTFVKHTRAAKWGSDQGPDSVVWDQAILAFLAVMIDRLANQCSTVAHWNQGGENIEGTFARFALPIIWDFAEVNPLGDTSGGYPGAFEWVARAAEHFLAAAGSAAAPSMARASAVGLRAGDFDLVLTDPPYYDAIPYSDLMDFFHVWLRRTLRGLTPEIDAAFRDRLGPKWNPDEGDGELIDDSSRHGGDRAKSRAAYEEGMYRTFRACQGALVPSGRMVIVFAHKDPDAWEALVGAIIRAGFVVDGSWPVQTERLARTRSLSSAALSSSVWLVCKKRPESALPGWDTKVLTEMRENIHARLKEFWDAGIRGPDFVWAATGPALEAYSRHPVVKKADEPGRTLEVSEFLRAVRRIVVDYAVGRVLTKDDEPAAETGLDDVTTYYLLHRHYFGLGDAPIGACILYAVSCGLSDAALVSEFDILVKTGGREEPSEAEEGEAADGEEEGTGSQVRLKPWDKRFRRGIPREGSGGWAPLIDRVHRLMHLWKQGDEAGVDEYLEANALGRNALFHRLLQALIELAEEGSDERSRLERIHKHLTTRSGERVLDAKLF
jgi:adenine-specific DNA methylase